MQKRIKNLFKHLSLPIAFFVTVSILCLSLIKLNKAPIHISNIDKVYHFIAYFTLAFTWLIAIKKARVNKTIKLLIVIAVISFGIIIELLQAAVTSYRQASFLDILANTFGVLLAWLLFNLLLKRKQSLIT